MNKIPISKDVVAKWKNHKTQTSLYEDNIQDRIDYILRVWFKAFGGELSYWYFDGAEEGEMGNMYRYFDDSSISGFIVGFKKEPECNHYNEEMVIIDRDGDEWAWESEIPTRWLFENFEEEITQGKKKYDEKLAKEKEEAQKRKSTKKEKDSKLVEAAKAKLSKEELAALKRAL